MTYFSLNNKSFIFALRIFIGCIIVWFSLYYQSDSHKIWAIISMIMVTDPDIDSLHSATISRIINTIFGCGIGLIAMSIAGASIVTLLIAIISSIVISSSFKRFPASWKLAPVAAAMVMAPSISDGVPLSLSMLVGLQRTAEIFFGALVAYAIGRIIFFFKNRNRSKA